MQTYQESQRILHVDPTASMDEIDAAFHKWHSFWSMCRSSVTQADQRQVAEKELELLLEAHRTLRGAAPISRAELEWFSPAPVQLRVQARKTPPPLPKRRPQPPPLPSRRLPVHPTRPIAALLAGVDDLALSDWAPPPVRVAPRRSGTWQAALNRGSLQLQVVMVTLAGLCVGVAAAWVASAYLQ